MSTSVSPISPKVLYILTLNLGQGSAASAISDPRSSVPSISSRTSPRHLSPVIRLHAYSSNERTGNAFSATHIILIVLGHIETSDSIHLISKNTFHFKTQLLRKTCSPLGTFYESLWTYFTPRTFNPEHRQKVESARSARS